MKLTRIAGVCLYIFFAWSIAAQSTPQTDPKKEIVGRWQGIGMAMLFEIDIKENGQYSIPDEPSANGQWEFVDSKFNFRRGGELHWIGEIDSDGRLIVSRPDEPAEKIPFRKKGTATAAANVAAGPQPPPTGEWHFAYLKKGPIPAAPPFDTIVFNDKKATFGFTPVGMTFERDYGLQNNMITLLLDSRSTFTQLMNFMPLGFALPRMLLIAYRWEDNGETLVLSNYGASQLFACEWAFLKPDKFSPNQFAGTWLGKGSQTGNLMDVHQDGTLVFRDGSEPMRTSETLLTRPKQYYRLWKSPFGEAISMMQLTQGMQLVHIQMAKIELQGRDIILTPIEFEFGEKMQLAENKANWKLLAEGEFESIRAAMAQDQIPSTPTISALDLVGDWEGKQGGDEIGLTFNLDGTVIWRASDREFRGEGLRLAQGRYAISKWGNLHRLRLHRFTDEDFEGRSFSAIIELMDENSLKFEMAQDEMPLEFSIEATTLIRKGPKPTISAAELEAYMQAQNMPPKPPYEVASLPTDTILLPGNLKLELVRIPAGTISINPPDERVKGSRKQTKGPITVEQDFYIGKTEITQAQWLAIMGKWPLDHNESADPRMRFVPRAVGDNFPAYYLSWDDCQKFVHALNAYAEESGQGPGNFRLPSSAESEYAHRAGTQTRFYWGDDPTLAEIDKYAWNSGNSEHSMQEVGQKLPNPWGLYDMSGNVEEWCADPARNNDNGRSRMYAMRGGGFNQMERAQESSFKNMTINYPNYDHGMRIARDVAGAK